MPLKTHPDQTTDFQLPSDMAEDGSIDESKPVYEIRTLKDFQKAGLIGAHQRVDDSDPDALARAYRNSIRVGLAGWRSLKTEFKLAGDGKVSNEALDAMLAEVRPEAAWSLIIALSNEVLTRNVLTGTELRD